VEVLAPDEILDKKFNFSACENNTSNFHLCVALFKYRRGNRHGMALNKSAQCRAPKVL